MFNQYEAGIKYQGEVFNLFLTGFMNTAEIFDGGVGSTFAAALLKTSTFGAEIDGAVSVEALRIQLTGTVQSGKITESSDPTAKDHKIWRQPDFQFRVSPSYNFQLANNLTAVLFGGFRYAGSRWNDRDNSYKLDSYTKLDAGLSVVTSGGITFTASGDNLTDSEGLTEGDPRDPLAKNGRPLLGRSFRFSVGVDF